MFTNTVFTSISLLSELAPAANFRSIDAARDSVDDDPIHSHKLVIVKVQKYGFSSKHKTKCIGWLADTDCMDSFKFCRNVTRR